MTVKKHLPAQFNDRIAGFSLEMMTIFFAILVVIFNLWHPLIEVMVVVGSFYVATLLPMHFYKGQSFGKKWTRIRIVNLQNEPISLKTAYLREFTKWVLGFITIGIYFIVAFIIFNKRLDRRTPHDLLYKTQVVLVDDVLV
ncbi:RDD family protein [Liberiplasma polymorphum]|uniref:RDD family protein n=1 Tax=Liberiplasma polymorphum TaxID=3374570 RepID=UPI0037727164